MIHGSELRFAQLIPTCPLKSISSNFTSFCILVCPVKAAITSTGTGLKEYKHFSFVQILFFQLIFSEKRQESFKHYTVISVMYNGVCGKTPTFKTYTIWNNPDSEKTQMCLHSHLQSLIRTKPCN